jgi:hypothetical protein
MASHYLILPAIKEEFDNQSVRESELIGLQ